MAHSQSDARPDYWTPATPTRLPPCPRVADDRLQILTVAKIVEEKREVSYPDQNGVADFFFFGQGSLAF
jgi:hypothetical protein